MKNVYQHHLIPQTFLLLLYCSLCFSSNLVLAQVRHTASAKTSNTNKTTAKTDITKEDQLYWMHKVQPTEDLDDIANNYGLSVSDMNRLNNLDQQKGAVTPGNYVLVPVEQLKKNHLQTSAPFTVHKVQSGEQLFSVARRYAVSVGEIKTLNQLESNTLTSGSFLKIPTVEEEQRASDLPAMPIKFHQVKERDNLHAIAQQYQISVEELKQLNNILGNRLEEGMLLKVPAQNQLRIKLHNEKPFKLHKVAKGERLHQIAVKYKVDVDDIKRLNILYANELVPGTNLLIPNPAPKIASKDYDKLRLNGFCSIGFYMGNDWEGASDMNYAITARFRGQYAKRKKPFIYRANLNTTLGFRHNIGKYFIKNLDRFDMRNTLIYEYPPFGNALLLHSVRTQMFDARLVRNNQKMLYSTFFSPAYTHWAIGYQLKKKAYDIQISLYELKATYVLDDRVYGTKSKVFGVEKGVKRITNHGVALRADIYYYDAEKMKIESNFYSFINGKRVDLDWRSQISFRINKMLKFVFVMELFYDKDYSEFVQYNTEFVTAINFYK